VQPVRVAGGIGSIKPLEDVFARLGRNTDAGITNLQIQMRILRINGQIHVAAGPVVFDGVVQKVRKDFTEFIRVRIQRHGPVTMYPQRQLARDGERSN